MATRFSFTPLSAEFPASNYPQLGLINRRPVLWFDAATDESCYWTGVAPATLTGTLTLVITFIMDSATSGTVGVQAQIEAVTADDALDLDATTSFDAVNNSASTTVAATAGYMKQISITLTNKDSIAAGDYFRLSINRDADGSAITDSATGDMGILAVELKDAA